VTVDDKERTKNWEDWQRYATASNRPPTLHGLDKPERQSLLIAFAARVRTGLYGKGRQVGHQTVEKALRHVAQTLELAGFADPRKTYGAKELDLPFRHLLKSYRDADPAPKPQLALPIATIQTAASRYEQHHSPRARAISDLICMSFFFLLRVGEYTMPRPGAITRTVQFRVQDVRLWKNGILLHNRAPRAELMTADAVTLYLENQKNGNKGATIHHTAATDWFCPVQALVRRVADIAEQGMGLDTPLSFVSPGVHIASKQIVSTVREAARLTTLTAHGYDLKRIGAHSLRASGAMAMKLNGVDAETIKKVGRWTSSTFLIYIHSQIAALNAGLAQRMVRPIYFQNVGG
jgi:integrase